MTRFEEISFMHWLKSEGLQHPKPIGNERYAAIKEFMFTHAIITGQIGDRVGYDDRWCYHDLGTAKAALEAWDGTGEPAGWHRHPASGRRRNGDATTEYINPDVY